MALYHPRYLTIGLAMLLAAGLALVLTPQRKSTDAALAVQLEDIVPRQFGNWKVDDSVIPVQASPEVLDKLSTLYGQTLARTYVNREGHRIMLSIAYGENQTRDFQAHSPAACYPAQGFEVLKRVPGRLWTPMGEISVTRMIATRGPRYEPITFWFKVGRYTTSQRNWARFRYTLTGEIPDGLLFRVSNVGMDDEEAFRLHQGFVVELINHLDAMGKETLVGEAWL